MSLNQAQLLQFQESGFLLLEDALTDQDLDPIIDEYEAYIDWRAHQLLSEDKISQLYSHQPFEQRLVSICRENNEIYSELDIMYLRGKASFQFLKNPNLMKIVSSIIGPEITCSPIQHIRAKLPTGLAPDGSDAHVAPWHQDAGVTWPEADTYFILTVWFPLVQATEENGCLQIIPSLQKQGLLRHHSQVGVGTTIVDEELPAQKILTLPMQKGSILLLNKDIPHRSTPNRSNT
ncbi:phytanoyl-CoA dioxygenase family protein, partial [Candidatus Poribacteria bacterium]|nr:phytanoyl-CoA dioxygenase family protein [Candidatus Poribacteria bacterium]